MCDEHLELPFHHNEIDFEDCIKKIEIVVEHWVLLSYLEIGEVGR